MLRCSRPTTCCCARPPTACRFAFRRAAPRRCSKVGQATRAAFMARMAGTLRHLGYLAPSYSRLDGFALTRTLVDHAITFGWLSGDPRERLPMFLAADFVSILNADDDARGRDDPLLEDANRKLFQDYVAAYTGPQMVEAGQSSHPGRRLMGREDPGHAAQVDAVCRVPQAVRRGLQALRDVRPPVDHRLGRLRAHRRAECVGRRRGRTPSQANRGPIGSRCSPSRRR